MNHTKAKQIIIQMLMSLNRRLLPDEKEALKYVLAVDMDLIDTLERMREEVEQKANDPLMFKTYRECYTWMLTLIDKYMGKYYTDDPEMFAQDSGMKHTDEYVKELVDKLKNDEIKG